jgi:CHAD domain-containing protein
VTLAAKKWRANVEYVHQMRVWSRRAVAATDLYAELLPTARRKWMEKKLKRIRRAANDARDDDVFAARLELDQANPGAIRLLQEVGEHREEAQKSVVEIYEELFDNGRFQRRAHKLLRKVRLRGEAADGGEVRFDQWATDRMRQEIEPFLAAAAADLSNADALHKFRIAGKRLRYAMELLASAFPEAFRKELYPQIQDLQDQLGQLNDHATAQVRLQHWIDESRDPEEAAYLRDMLAQEQQHFDQSRREFFAWWDRPRETQLRESFVSLVD